MVWFYEKFDIVKGSKENGDRSGIESATASERATLRDQQAIKQWYDEH